MAACAQRVLPPPPDLPPLGAALDGRWQWQDGGRARVALEMAADAGAAEWQLLRQRVSARYRLARSGASEGVFLLVFIRDDGLNGGDERKQRLTPEWFSVSGVRVGDQLLVRLDSSDCVCRRDAVFERIAAHALAPSAAGR